MLRTFIVHIPHRAITIFNSCNIIAVISLYNFASDNSYTNRSYCWIFSDFNRSIRDSIMHVLSSLPQRRRSRRRRRRRRRRREVNGRRLGLRNIAQGPFGRRIESGQEWKQRRSLRLEGFDSEIPCRIPRVVPFIEAPIILVYARARAAASRVKVDAGKRRSLSSCYFSARLRKRVRSSVDTAGWHNLTSGID